VSKCVTIGASFVNEMSEPIPIIVLIIFAAAGYALTFTLPDD